MQSNVFSPPNSSAFSDAVIGSVVQSTQKVSRTAHIGCVTQKEGIPAQGRTCFLHAQNQPLKRVYPSSTQRNDPNSQRESTNSTTVSSIAELIEQTDSSTGPIQTSCISVDLRNAYEIIASMRGTNRHITDKIGHTIKGKILEKKVRHQEHCWFNQANYAQMLMKTETKMEDEIAKLKSEINRLEWMCEDFSRLPKAPTLWTIAVEYLRHFNYFVSSPVMLQTAASKFLRCILAPNVMVGSHFGVGVQLENWRLFALYFEDVLLDLISMNSPTPNSLVAGIVISFTITSKTLCHVFPHLSSDGCGGRKGGVWSPLATQMLDRKLVMRGSLHFSGDNVTYQVVKMHFQADAMTPMIKLLGNIRNVSYAFDKAGITPDGNFVSIDCKSSRALNH